MVVVTSIFSLSCNKKFFFFFHLFVLNFKTHIHLCRYRRRRLFPWMCVWIIASHEKFIHLFKMLQVNTEIIIEIGIQKKKITGRDGVFFSSAVVFTIFAVKKFESEKKVVSVWTEKCAKNDSRMKRMWSPGRYLSP